MKEGKVKKTTPSNCKKMKCPYNQAPPDENSQECIGCEGNRKKKQEADHDHL